MRGGVGPGGRELWEEPEQPQAVCSRELAWLWDRESGAELTGSAEVDSASSVAEMEK